MLHDPFLRVGSVDVDAAVLGIGRMRWKSAEPDWDADKALMFMQEHGYDVLPIEKSKDDPILNYFVLSNASEKRAEKKEILYEDLISAKTPAIDLIEKFACKDRKFFFLTYENQIGGLITSSDLNTHQMKLAIFALVAELETRLGRFVSKYISNEEIENFLRKKVTERYIDGELSGINRDVVEFLQSKNISDVEIEIFFSKKEKPIAIYEKDKLKGVERDIIEYVYLRDLISFVAEKELFKKLGYISKTNFKNLNTLNDLRNDVAHPVNSLVTEDKPVSKLWERIGIMQDALFRLRQHQG